MRSWLILLLIISLLVPALGQETGEDWVKKVIGLVIKISTLMLLKILKNKISEFLKTDLSLQPSCVSRSPTRFGAIPVKRIPSRHVPTSCINRNCILRYTVSRYHID